VIRLRIVRRLLQALLVVSLLLLAGRAIVGERGMLEVWRQRARLESLRQEVALAETRNQAVLDQITDIRSGGLALEELARERLGFIKPGEVTFLFPEESSDPTPPGAEQAPAPAPAP